MESMNLIVRRRIRAPATRLFEAWTQPAHLEKWWGPKGVSCVGVEVDLRVGGRYRIGNEMPDGQVMWITGEFERITPPDELVYTWAVGDAPSVERVTVRFVSSDDDTEVVVIHERITSEEARKGHEAGWLGCLEGLLDYVGS